MLLSVLEHKKPIIRLARVQETSSGKTWIFDFVDPVNGIGQSIIMPKTGEPEHLEICYEKLWRDWSTKIKEAEWKEGRAPVPLAVV